MSRLKLTVRGQKALIANLKATNHESRERFRVTTRTFAQRIRDRAAQLAAKDTGYMARSTKYKLSADELTFEAGWWVEDFLPHGLPFYPPFVEFGTSQQAAQPALGPAYEESMPDYVAAIREDIRRAT